MANKVKLMKLLQEIHGYERVTNRRPTPRPAILYLMQLRAQQPHPQIPRQRTTLATDWQAGEDPVPVQIKHITPEDSEIPVVVL